MEIKKEYFWYGILALVLIVSFIINLNVSLNEPLIFGDEGFYASRGKWISENWGIPKYLTQSEAFGNFFLRPPLFIFLVSSCFMLGGELLVKALNPILSVLVGLVSFFLIKRIYSLKVAVLAILFLVMIPSLITYTVFLYPEVFSLLLVTCCVYFFYRCLTEDKKIFVFLAGLFAGLSLLTEAGAMALPLVLLGMFLLYRKGSLKKFISIILILFIVAFPWFGLHNYLIFGNPALSILTSDMDFPIEEVFKEIPDIDVGKIISPQELGRGTQATILNMGLMNYIQFAYSMVPFVFATIGFSFLALRRNKKDLTILIWFLVFLILSFIAAKGGRAEDAVRAMIYITVPLALMAGIASDEIYRFLKTYGETTGKVMGILFVLALLVFALFSTNAKVENLRPAKQFSEAFFKGCDWIRENTPEDSLLVTLWGSRTEYACKRGTLYWGVPGGEEMIFAGDNTTYEIMKIHGADYIYIQKFSIRPGKEKVSYPWVFVKYVKNSEHFEKVYEYPGGCMNTQQIDCVVVYKVL